MSAVIDDFSAQYFILPGHDYRDYSGDVVGIDTDEYQGLRRFSDQPLVKMAGEHHWLRPQWGIPSGTVAIPSDVGAVDDAVLVAKEETARQLLTQGVVEPPRHGGRV